MWNRCFLWLRRARPGAALAVFLTFQTQTPAQMRDGGIDPKNLGKGDWIYVLPSAIAQMSGNVPAVTNLSSMMAFLKNQGLKYVIIKAATSDYLYPSNNDPQFTAEVVNAGHAAGLWVFGYNRSDGLNIPGEIAIADYVFNTGADGFVFDAESEWESQNLPNNTNKAVQSCSAVRSNWPTKFLAHAPAAYRNGHASFPYKEFGYYCDTVMPQAYFIEFGDTPTQTVTRMNNEWTAWQNGVTGIWTNAIKTLAPVGQGWSSASGNITPALITEFVNALKTVTNCPTAGGYKGVNYWRAELHPASVWDAVRTNNIGTPPAGAPVVTNVTASSVGATNATLIWTTDQSSDSVVEYGLTTGYGSSTTNTAMVHYHTLNLTGLSNNTTYQFRAKSKNGANQIGISGNDNFTTPTALITDIYLDDTSATFVGSWVSSSSANAYGGGYRYITTVAGGTSTATFTPNIVTAGKYDVYVTFIMGSNRTTNSNWTVSYSGGSTNVRVNQTGTAGASSGWVRIASGVNFAVGTAGYVRLSNNSLPVGTAAIADAVKLVFVPPPPSAPRISAQPSGVTTNQGKTVTFTVAASGTAPLAYQWRREGTNLTGATVTSYTKTNVQPADAGNYSLVITNSFGAANSANALLTVVPLTPPHIDSITVLSDRRTQLQVSGGPGSFAVDHTPNLTGWTQSATTNVSGSVFQYTDSQTNQTSRYYRARLLY